MVVFSYLLIHLWSWLEGKRRVSTEYPTILMRFLLAVKHPQIKHFKTKLQNFALALLTLYNGQKAHFLELNKACNFMKAINTFGFT